MKGTLRYVAILLGLRTGRGLSNLLIRGSGGTFLLQAVGAGLGLATSIVIARTLGPGPFGLFAYVLVWLELLALLARIGMTSLLLRSVAAYGARGEWGLCRGLVRFALRLVMSASVVVTVIAAVVGFVVCRDSSSMALRAFLIALPGLPLLAWNECRQSVLRALGHPILGQLPDRLIRPVAMLAFAVAAALILGPDASPTLLLGLAVATHLLAFVGGWFLLRRRLPAAFRDAEPQTRPGEWMSTGFSMLLLTALQVVSQRADIVMLGAIAGTSATGLYAAASRGAELVVFIPRAVNAVLAPVAAGLFANGEKARLQYVVTRATRVATGIALTLALLLVLFGGQYLSLFGEGFGQGSAALTILALSFMVNAACGPVGYLLTMTGHERLAVVGSGTTAALNIVLNLVLIPTYGLLGAAIATAVSSLVWDVMYVSWVVRRLGIRPTIFTRIGAGSEPSVGS